MAAVVKKPQYTAKEKRVYQVKRKEERAAKNQWHPGRK